MKLSIRDWNVNQKLALLVGALGFLALFAGSPYKGSEVKVDSKELAVIVEKEVDHVSPEDLAGWIIQGKSDYRLIDLRNEKDFSEYHIPSAENVSLTSLRDAQLTRNEKIVLYSDGGIHSAQAWFLLRAENYKGVYILLGGLEDWKEKILFPRLPENASSAEVAAFERTKLVSKFFGGSPQVGGASEAQAPKLTLPKLESPGGPQQKVAPGKKKKEGC
jgi:rhodanese-related sulfurtransferase